LAERSKALVHGTKFRGKGGTEIVPKLLNLEKAVVPK